MRKRRFVEIVSWGEIEFAYDRAASLVLKQSVRHGMHCSRRAGRRKTSRPAGLAAANRVNLFPEPSGEIPALFLVPCSR